MDEDSEYRAIPKAALDALGKRPRFTFHISLGDVVVAILFLIALSMWWLDSRDWRRDMTSWKAQMVQSHADLGKVLNQNSVKLDHVLNTQKRVVDILTDFPPHRHVAGQIVYPNQLPKAPDAKDPGKDDDPK